MTEVETPKFNKSHSLMARVQQPPNKAQQPTFDPSPMALPHHGRRLKRG